MKIIFQILSVAIMICRPMECMDHYFACAAPQTIAQPQQGHSSGDDIIMEDTDEPGMSYRCTCGCILPTKENFVRHCKKHIIELQAQQQYIQQKQTDDMICSFESLQIDSAT